MRGAFYFDISTAYISNLVFLNSSSYGVYAQRSTITIDNSRFSDGFSTYVYTVDSHVQVRNTIFENNS